MSYLTMREELFADWRLSLQTGEWDWTIFCLRDMIQYLSSTQHTAGTVDNYRVLLAVALYHNNEV